jgi:hypothetical protein
MLLPDQKMTIRMWNSGPPERLHNAKDYGPNDAVSGSKFNDRARVQFEKSCALTMFRSASNRLLSDDLAKTWGSRMVSFWPVILLHAGALALLVATEDHLVGAVAFLLTWIMLNGLCLVLVRRPTVAALMSLEVLVALTLLSRFKFDKLWMTIDFVDVMIIDRDTTAFLLAVFPALRWWIMLAAVATILVIIIAWRADRYRIKPKVGLACLGFGRRAGRCFAALAHRAE